jgi:shikimate kinase
MFTGKSSVGRRLASKLDLEFVDLDEQIVLEAGCQIPDIFEQSGETGFRAIEQDVLARVLPQPGRVFSTGGGVVISPANRELLLRHSCVVWLTATVETVLGRFRDSRGKPRPLLQVNNPEVRIAKLLAEREEFYAECDIRVVTDGRSVHRVTEEIIRKVTSVDAIHEG